MPSRFVSKPLVESLIPWLMLLVLFVYTAANFVGIPYTGLYFIEASGRVSRVYAPGGDVQAEDILLEVGGVPFAEFQAGRSALPFQLAPPGETLPVVLERDGQVLTVSWTVPGFTFSEFFNDRFFNQWYLAYIFWGIGTFALLALRPRDQVQRLFAAFCYLTALWLIASTASRWHLWLSPQVLRSTIWLSVPVYWHLHWAFPRPLARLPRWVGWLLYGLFGALAVLEWFQAVPPSTYALGLLLAAAGSLVLLLAHVVAQRAGRRQSFIVIGGGLLALLPTVVLSISTALLGLGAEIALVGLLALPLLPVGYLVAIARHRLGGREVRLTRALSLYLFFVLVITGLLLVASLFSAAVGFSGDSVLLAGLAGLGAGLLSLYAYAPFQRFVEERLLGLPPAPRQLLETYAARISTRLETDSLVPLLRDEILAGLLVRQSALLRLAPTGPAQVVYIAGVEPHLLPAAGDTAALISQSGLFRPVTADGAHVCPWVRLALALRVQGQVSGLWLLGQRDPDDFYAPSEIPILQALADQTAIALANIAQAELLHALYQADINQAETERTALARELHDGPLQQLNLLRHSLAGLQLPPDFHNRYAAAVRGLRQVVSGLRPGMLDYGLHAGLVSLVDELDDLRTDGPRLTLAVPQSAARYPETVEQHVFRIVQQACQNAQQHAQAHTLNITGRLEAGVIDLSIEDDGLGLNLGGPVNLAALAAHRHFGLTGMYERAALIGAKLAIEAGAERGTRVRLHWDQPPA